MHHHCVPLATAWSAVARALSSLLFKSQHTPLVDAHTTRASCRQRRPKITTELPISEIVVICLYYSTSDAVPQVTAEEGKARPTPIPPQQRQEMGEGTLLQRTGSAVFYASASFLIVVVNKLVLTSYRFPDQALGLGQLVVTITVLRFAKGIGYINFPDTSTDSIRKTWPLPLLYFLNLVCGLGSTKRLNLPMFTVLRRFSILMTLLLEKYMLGNDRSTTMKISVYAMVLGAIIAGSDDLAFDMVGYVLILINDLATALNGVYTMKKLQAKELGKHGILYYNSLLALLPTTLVAYYTGGVDETLAFPSWSDPVFLLEFVGSCCMGVILMYATVLCTQYNSALTTTVVGVLKNIIITYLGMFIGGDYIFSLTNFLGLNISAAASVAYSYYEFVGSKNPERKTTVEPSKARGDVEPKTTSSSSVATV